MDKIEEMDQKTNGRWSKVEHQKFLLGLELYGKNWKKIQQLVGTRTGSQIRSHAQKFFLKTGKDTDKGSNHEEDPTNYLQKKPKTVIQKCQKIADNIPDHSYYMSKIIKATTFQRGFNFWEQFIGLGSSNSENQSIGQNPRKDSFAIFDICNDSKQETTLYHLSIGGEPILSNY